MDNCTPPLAKEVERAARAIHLVVWEKDRWDTSVDVFKDHYRAMARAAIATMSPPAPPPTSPASIGGIEMGEQSAIPALGDWLIPRDQSLPGDHYLPGIVVDVLPDGSKAILARRSSRTGKLTETVYDVADLKGPMNGRPTP